ncbi:N-acetyltransferase [Phaeocystidibacter marisrubri]|uniref:N-acetyltransferase n=2 Tax=Phaeocystidibacter marisrubri TaxID=1577780 RepID=A0A6L3ZJF4_9FLAO|nr:N-acetyltransferase [Phaeocystidibacter marisrubri]
MRNALLSFGKILNKKWNLSPTKMSSETHQITEHLTEDNRGEYQILSGNDVQAYMKFSRLEKIIILHHTEVKPFLRGKGAGKALLNYAVKDARTRNLKIVPLCPYSRKTMEGDPKYADILQDA